MILNKIGQSFYFKGKEYVIGNQILATNESVYEGLGGIIAEIRDGKDKETNNLFPDIYCDFKVPVLRCDFDKFKDRFSKHYGSNVRLDEIPLDAVIMAPSMIEQMVRDVPTITIYVMEEDWACDGDFGHRVYIYPCKDEAKYMLNQLLSKEKDDGMVKEWMKKKDFGVESNEMMYEAWLSNRYEYYHYKLEITECQLQLSDTQVGMIGREHESRCATEDYLAKASEMFESGNISLSQYQKITQNPSASKRISDKLSKNDCYLEQYWDVVEQIIKEEIKK